MRSRPGGPDGRRGLGARVLLRALAPYALPHAWLIGLSLLMVVAATAVKLLRPWPLKVLFDEVLITSGPPSGVDALLLGIAGAIVGIALLGAVVGYFEGHLLRTAGQKVAYRLRTALYRKIHHLSLSFHDRQQTGELMTRVTKDVDKVQELVTDNVVDATSNALTLVGMLVVMLWVDWQLSLAMLVLNPVLFVVSRRFRAKVRVAELDVRQSEGDISSITQETISSVRLVKSFGRESYESDRFDEQAQRSVVANLRASRAEAAYGSGVSVLTAVATAGLVYLGARRVLSGALSAGDLLLFTAYIRDFYGPTRSLSRLGARIARTSVRAERIVEILQDQRVVEDLPGAVAAPRLSGHVRFERVSFEYLAGQPVLTDVSFEALPGQTVALVGATGAGKTTLASLVARLYEPTTGRVLVDGQDVRSYTVESLQRQVSFLLQESVLFRASVRENIAYGNPDASSRQICDAARAANAHEFVVGLPEGYETVVGERGETLSGGQRQRIAIARALVRDAPIVVLDEPTAGLDARTESEVLEALGRLAAGRTTIVVAHRLATIRHADLILVLDAGRILEQGRHDDLLAAGGRYAELWALQTGATDSPLAVALGPSAGADGEATTADDDGDQRRAGPPLPSPTYTGAGSRSVRAKEAH